MVGDRRPARSCIRSLPTREPGLTSMDLWTLSDLATPWCIHVAVTLRVADHIEAGLSRIDEIATAAGADRDSPFPLCSGSWSARVCSRSPRRVLCAERKCPHAARGRCPARPRPRWLRGPDGGCMDTLLSAVRTGRPAYHEAFGRPFWEDLEAHPDLAEKFDAMMGPGHGEPDPQVLIDPADWGSIRTVVDLGDGT